MKDEIDTARDDLGFLKALVSEGGQAQASLGFLLFWAGLCYGVHTLGLWTVERGWVQHPQGLAGLFVAMLPTVIFIGLIIYVVIHDRAASQHGVATRALNAAFGGAGLASLTTAIIFGYISTQRKEIFLWMFHPITVFVVQGTVWYIAFAIRRRLWLGLVSAGWHGAAIAMGVLLQHGQTSALLLVLGFGLLVLMALPGWILWKSART